MSTALTLGSCVVGGLGGVFAGIGALACMNSEAFRARNIAVMVATAIASGAMGFYAGRVSLAPQPAQEVVSSATPQKPNYWVVAVAAMGVCGAASAFSFHAGYSYWSWGR